MVGETRPVVIEGLDKAKEGLRGIDRAAPRLISRAGKKAAKVVAEEAKRRAPVYAGPPRTRKRLRDSIKVSGTQRYAGIRIGGPDAPHAPVHEFGGTIRRAGGQGGTSRARRRALGRNNANTGRTVIKAQPYLYPAIADKRREVVDIFTAEFDSMVEREWPQVSYKLKAKL